MNGTVHIDQRIVQIMYYRYKDYVIPLVAFILSWVVFFQFVLPEIQNFLSVKTTVEANEQTLAILTQNYNTVVSLDPSQTKSLLTTANQAIPQEKDFAGVLNAIAAAAGVSGAVVNDYTFQVGNINSSDQSPSLINQTIQLSLSINGDINQTKQFLDALANQLPLSQVTNVTVSKQKADITANFYYSPLPKLAFVDTQQIPVLSVAQKNMLTTLAKNVSQVPVGILSPTPELSPAETSSTSSQ